MFLSWVSKNWLRNYHYKSLGLVIFLSVTALILGFILLVGNKSVTSPSVSQRIQPLILSIDSPTDGQVLTNDLLILKGKTSPKSTVVIFTVKSINSVDSDVNGQFEEIINLLPGLNNLNVHAFAENGEEKSVVLDVVYDNDSRVKGERTESGQPEKSKDQPLGQEKKQEQEVPQQPPGQLKKEEPVQTAIVGNVEEVTPDSVVVEEKSSKKEIETKVDENTLIKNQEDEILKLSSIQQNDQAAVITKDDLTQTVPKKVTSIISEEGITEVKKAERIFVNQATSSAQIKRHAIQGIITAIEGNRINIVHQIHADRIFTLIVNNETAIKIKGEIDATLNDLAIGQRIAVVGELNTDGMLVAKWIHVIPGKVSSALPPALPSTVATPTVTEILPNSPTPTISSGTVTAVPTIPPPCTLTLASWNTSSNPVREGTLVKLSVSATGDCSSQQVSFEVRENDSLIEGGIDDPVNIQPPSVTFPLDTQVVEGAWVAEWQNDCAGLCNPPEYYFNANLVGGNAVRSPDLLSVDREVAVTPTPSPTPTATSTILSARSQTVYGADGTKCFDSDGNNPLNERLYIKGYCQDNSGVYYDYCQANIGNIWPIVEYYCIRNWIGGGTDTTRCQGGSRQCSFCGQCVDGAFQDPSLTSSNIEGPTPTPFPISSYPDTLLPVITRISPTAGSTVSGIVTIEVSATDNIGVTRVEFYISDVHNSTEYLGTVTDSPYKLLWDTTQYKNNTGYLIYATAFDAQGNSSQILWSAIISNPTPTPLP